MQKVRVMWFRIGVALHSEQVPLSCTGNVYLCVQLVSGDKQFKSQLIIHPAKNGELGDLCLTLSAYSGRREKSCVWLCHRQTKESLWTLGSAESYLSHMVNNDWFFAVSYFSKHRMVVDGLENKRLGIFLNYHCFFFRSIEPWWSWIVNVPKLRPMK